MWTHKQVRLNLIDPGEGDVLGCSQVTENGRVSCKNYRLSIPFLSAILQDFAAIKTLHIRISL